MFFLLSQSKRSLSIELEDYFESLGVSACTKSAFSKARYRVLWCFFEAWHKHFVNLIYSDRKDLRTWRGFFLKAIDGTSIYLFKDEEVEKAFGGSSNQHLCVPMARSGLELDVLNGYCTQVQLQAHSVGEVVFAEAFLEDCKPWDMRIYDRNFAGYRLISKHIEKNAHFLMRCTVGFNSVVKAFVASGKRQAIVNFTIPKNEVLARRKKGEVVDPKETLRVRLLRIEIGKDEPEILITNLLNLKKYPHSCFKELYNYRWKDEGRFDQIKNKLQIEVFSGHKAQAIYQDFFATIIASNLHNLICEACTQEIQQINAHKITPSAINQNVSIGLLKKRMSQLLTDPKPQEVFSKLKTIFLRYLEPVRPGRYYPRPQNVRRLNGKYQTFKNYRRAS